MELRMYVLTQRGPTEATLGRGLRWETLVKNPLVHPSEMVKTQEPRFKPFKITRNEN